MNHEVKHMKKGTKLALAALALSVTPFSVKVGKDGEFSCKSLLIGLSSRKTGEGKRTLTISLFNLPDFLKKKPGAEPTPEPAMEQPADSAL